VNPFEDVIIELDAALTGNSSGVSAVSAVRDAAAPGRLKRGDHLVLSDYKTRFFQPCRAAVLGDGRAGRGVGGLERAGRVLGEGEV
jgi:hypothetical protein